MYLLLVDESNIPPKDGQFFIYGGIAVDAAQLPKLTRKVDAIRSRFGYRPSDNLKFSNQSGIAPEVHRKAKRKVLRQIDRAGGKLIATVVLERVLASKPPEEYVGWAVNAVTQAFHEFLRDRDGHGVILMDRVDKGSVNQTLAEMADRFQSGLSFPDGYRRVNDRILLFGMTNNNSSHLSSCTDVALGSLRYCMNSVTGHANANPDVAAKMAPQVRRLWWRRGLETYAAGYLPRPLRFRSSRVERSYIDFKKALRRLGAI